jgi:hypothetical protein
MLEVAVATTPKASVCSYLLCSSQYELYSSCAAYAHYLYDLTILRRLYKNSDIM